MPNEERRAYVAKEVLARAPQSERIWVLGYLATRRGTNVDCCDYLFDTVDHLRELDIRDRRMEALAPARA